MPAPSYALTNYAGTLDPAGDIIALIETRLTDAGWLFIEQASFTQAATARYMRVWKCPAAQNIAATDFYIGLVKNQAAGTYLACRSFEGYDSGAHTIQRPCLSGAASQAPQGVAWSPRTLSASASWKQIIFANGLFAAVGNGSASFTTSPDGSTWTTRTLPSSSNWNGIAYGAGIGGGTWVAISGSTNVAASTTDITAAWTARTLPSSSTFTLCAYGNPGGTPIFVAISGVSNTTVAASSTDGTTWQARTIPAPGTSVTYTALAYGGGKFVAIPTYIGGAATAAYSTDGINWNTCTLPASTIWSAIGYANGFFVAVSGSGGNSTIAATSPDGINWTQRALPVSAAWCSVAYLNGTWVTMTSNGASVATSTDDGATWTTRLASATSVGNTLAAGAGVFVATGNSGTAAGVNAMDFTYPYHAGSGNWALDGSTVPAMLDCQTTTALVASTNYDVGVLASRSYLVVGVNTLGTSTQVFSWVLGLFKPIYPESQATYPPLIAIGDIKGSAAASNGVSRSVRATFSTNAFLAYPGPESMLLGNFVNGAVEPSGSSIRGSRVMLGAVPTTGFSNAGGGAFRGWLYDCIAVNTGGSTTVTKIGDSITIGGVNMIALGQSLATGTFMSAGSCAFFFDVAAGS